MTLSKTLLTAAMATGALALDPIVVKGTKFFFENGTQFFMKGVAYQQDTSAGGGGVRSANFNDPLANPAACRRDIPLLQELGTNTIRTYAIDPGADHTVCMGLLEDAGIYVISDLGEPRLSIETDNPQWNIDLFDRYKAVIDELASYTNVIGFFAGNEVTTNKTNTPASAYVKAAVRDTKAYIAEKNYPLYVGYAANDDPDVRRDIAHYFNCGDDQKEAIDFWGYNIYQWCGESTIKKSGYSQQIDFFANYSVPVFFAEYGCNTGPKGAESRIWQETVALYEDEMTEVFSGGIVYMYFQEANDYGLVELNGNTAVRMDNFKALAKEIKKVDPTLLDMDDYTPTNKPQACPPVSDVWAVDGATMPPTPDEKVCECMYAKLSCVPSSRLDPKDYGNLFGFVCGEEDGLYCRDINGNVTSGKYGAFSMCHDKQKLAYVLDQYWQGVGSDDACDFDGQATLVEPQGGDDECEEKLTQATEAANVGGSDSGEDDDDSSGARVAVGMGLWLLAALGVGAGMVL